MSGPVSLTLWAHNSVRHVFDETAIPGVACKLPKQNFATRLLMALCNVLY